MSLRFIDSPDFKATGKKVLVRFDFNVPLDKETGEISDTTRIDETLPTIKFILEQNPKKLIIMSHLGRPNGTINKKYTLEPVASYLASVLNEEITLSETPTDSGIKTFLGLSTGRILMLENLRFDPREELNDQQFCKTLASYGDIFVNDAFGVCHRKHSSIYGINAFYKNKGFGGFLLKKEIHSLDIIIESPKRPFVAILGGAKISDKIKVLEKLLPSVDSMIIGGAMAYPFLKAKGIGVGKSLCKDGDVKLAQKILTYKTATKLILPEDHIVSSSFDGDPESTQGAQIDEDKMGLDIGAKSVLKFKSVLSRASTILWNGPMGMFENSNFENGTMEMAKALSECSGITVVGGGDSVAAINKANVQDKITHVSTGGGASLEYIENHGAIPGISALKFGVEF